MKDRKPKTNKKTKQYRKISCKIIHKKKKINTSIEVFFQASKNVYKKIKNNGYPRTQEPML